ncbi:hypothetical protein BDZ94DRAFT_1242876 [Collybia nuda]|uniref:Uncharacterized protein n=1 Tax=Collybia nuda TaxID=64659 RepID=A0A9P6CKJ7_9AGAR|nr:hypothetical protein BDZ94DRAFT_1242876 [Collybia nuda]
MPRLNLKRTPEEEAARQQRKKRKEEKRRRRKDVGDTGSSKKRRRTDDVEVDTLPKWASSDDESGGEYGPQPGPSSPKGSQGSYKVDYDAIRAEMEEQRFREKMFGALEDDERLDSLEARLNDFAHVPGRWRSGSGGVPGKAVYDEPQADDFLNVDPRYMDDEEYAEWIRVGMYRKTHAEEYAEQQRKKTLHAARRAEEKAKKAETKRLEKLAEEERLRKKLERLNRRWDYAREEYDTLWKKLLSAEDDSTLPQQDLGFSDIPWPILAAYRHQPDKRKSFTSSIPTTLSLDNLTTEAISEFLLTAAPTDGTQPPPLRDVDKKERKEKLRETFLRFHPDKFEGRFMKRIKASDREIVREAIGQVVRGLNTLMGDIK